MKTANEAVRDICHVSERQHDCTVYTFKDIRFPEYMDCQVASYLVHGQVKFKWLKRPKRSNK